MRASRVVRSPSVNEPDIVVHPASASRAAARAEKAPPSSHTTRPDLSIRAPASCRSAAASAKKAPCAFPRPGARTSAITPSAPPAYSTKTQSRPAISDHCEVSRSSHSSRNSSSAARSSSRGKISPRATMRPNSERAQRRQICPSPRARTHTASPSRGTRRSIDGTCLLG